MGQRPLRIAQDALSQVKGYYMAYKDKDKQREANRIAAKKYRDSMTDKGMTVKTDVIPKSDIPVIPNATVAEGVTSPFRDDTGKEPIDFYKRGKDITCFADLPPDVQAAINKMSVVDGKLNEAEKHKRTAAAITYQHLFPDRYEPQAGLDAIVTGLPGDPDYDGVCLDAKYDDRRIKA